MSQISETADLEAEIEALLKRAGERLRQTRDELHHERASEGGPNQVSQPPLCQ